MVKNRKSFLQSLNLSFSLFMSQVHKWAMKNKNKDLCSHIILHTKLQTKCRTPTFPLSLPCRLLSVFTEKKSYFYLSLRFSFRFLFIFVSHPCSIRRRYFVYNSKSVTIKTFETLLASLQLLFVSSDLINKPF